ncbi:MAG: GntR family transcriptional regulator [Clostridia bacterium]|nr:GntR family transcriptional regulator [Clostridia bacterium]
MNIKLDKANPIPIGVQVKEQIKMLINSGDYKEGDKLPSINQLAAFLGVNKNTVVTVLKDLENEGYIWSQRGKGVFVSDKKKGKKVDAAFINSVDLLISGAKIRGLDASELINLISARFSYALAAKKRVKVLFAIGITQELLDVNLKKLREEILGADFEGLLLNSEMTRDHAFKAFSRADLVVVPSVAFDFIRDFLPKDKPLIKTMLNLKLLARLKKGVEKKSKVAVIGSSSYGAKALSNTFISAKLFKPKLVLAQDSVDEHKKEFKEIDSVVVCLSAKSAIEEKPYLKNKNIYIFSDYIDDESIEDIKLFIRKFE